MKKKLLCILLTGVLCCGLLSGCGSEKKEDVTLIIKVPALTMATFLDQDIETAYDFLQKAGNDFAAQYEDANVTVEVYQFEQTDEAKAVAGCFGTEDAADILYEGYFNMSTYIHSGYVVPLDDIITEEIRNDISDSYWNSSRLNGKTYMIPYLGLQNTLSYNKELFRNAGLDQYISEENEVQSWTLEEWNEILAALRESLPDNSYPMMMYALNNQGDTHIMTLLRMYGSDFFDEQGYFNLETEEGIAALQWIRDGYEAGYFPANAESMEINDCFDLFVNGQLAIYIVNSAIEASLRDTDIDYGYVNFPTLDGAGANTTFITGFEVYDNGNEAKLAAAKAFVKYIYESDYLDYSAGGIPCSNSVAEKYAEELEPLQKYINVGNLGVNFTGNNPNWRGVRDAFYPCIQDLLYGDKTPAEVARELDENCNAAIEEGYAESTLHE